MMDKYFVIGVSMRESSIRSEFFGIDSLNRAASEIIQLVFDANFGVAPKGEDVPESERVGHNCPVEQRQWERVGYGDPTFRLVTKKEFDVLRGRPIDYRDFTGIKIWKTE